MKTIYKHTFISLCFFTLTSTAFSQSTKIDSLQNQLLIHKGKDTLRVNTLNAIAVSFFRKKHHDKTIHYLDESEAIARAINYKKGMARSLFLRGISTANKTKFNSGDKFYKEALLLYEEIGLKKRIALIYFNLGVFYSRNKDYESSIDYYSKSVKIKEEIGNQDIYFDLNYLARAYVKTGNFNQAILSYKKALKISEQQNNTKETEDCLSSIGYVYSHQGNYPLALEYLNKSLASAKKNDHTKSISDALLSIGNVYIRLQKYDKAIIYHNNALSLELEKGNKRNVGSIFHNLGESYKYKKDYKKALDFFEKSIVRFREYNNEADVAVSLNKIGEIYLEQKKTEEAYKYFEKAKKINLAVNNPRGLCGSYLGLAKVLYNKKKYSQSLNMTLKGKELSIKLELLDLQKDIESLLSKIYDKMNAYEKALVSHQQFKILNDSLFNKENIEKITQLEYEYKYKQALDSASIRELKLTKKVQATSQNLEKSQRNYLWAIIGVLLVSILLGSVIFYQKLRNAKSKTQNAIMEQKLLRSQMTPHFIFNSLSVLQGMILNKEEKKSVDYLSKFSKLLRITLENSRDKTVSLSQELTAIQDYLALQNLENENYKFTILVEDSIAIPKFEIPPMLIQPFVENAIEHAFINQKENRKIDIRLTFSDDKLVCTIGDNGVGINYENGNKRKDKKSLATTITSERLKILSKDLNMQGSVMVEDRQIYGEQGTIVTLDIPHKII